MGSVKVGKVGVDDPLVLWAGGPRSTSDVGTYDSLWVRLVDLPGSAPGPSLDARPCDVIVEVEDVTAPWNDGPLADPRRRRVGHGGAKRATPDATLSVQSLGAAYLGAGNLVAQHRAGLVAEQRAGAVGELSGRCGRRSPRPSPSTSSRRSSRSEAPAEDRPSRPRPPHDPPGPRTEDTQSPTLLGESADSSPGMSVPCP